MSWSSCAGQPKSAEPGRRPTSRIRRSVLHQLRQELKAYVRQLYHHYPFGLSLFDAISRYGELTDARDGIAVDQSVFTGLDQSAVEKWFSLIGELTAAGRDCGGPYGHPLADFQVDTWSQTLRTSAADQLRELSDQLTMINQTFRQLGRLLDFGQYLPPERFSELADADAISRHLLDEADLLAQICQLAVELPHLPSAILRQGDWPIAAAHLKIPLRPRAVDV
jgi:hypothetical protein